MKIHDADRRSRVCDVKEAMDVFAGFVAPEIPNFHPDTQTEIQVSLMRRYSPGIPRHLIRDTINLSNAQPITYSVYYFGNPDTWSWYVIPPFKTEEDIGFPTFGTNVKAMVWTSYRLPTQNPMKTLLEWSDENKHADTCPAAIIVGPKRINITENDLLRDVNQTCVAELYKAMQSNIHNSHLASPGYNFWLQSFYATYALDHLLWTNI